MISSSMRLHRFILDLDLADDRLVISDFETINQIRNVLRLEVGDRFVVCDGKGKEATVQIFTGPLGPSERDAPKGAGNILVDVLDRRDVASESSARVTLYCAVLKRENFELVVQKVTECGIAAIVPIISTRTVKLGVKLERLEKIAREASEQSGRGVIPEILGPIPLKDASTPLKWLGKQASSSAPKAAGTTPRWNNCAPRAII